MAASSLRCTPSVHLVCYSAGFAFVLALAGTIVANDFDPTSAEAKRYDGLTLAEWRARIKSIDYEDAASAAAVPGLLAIVEDTDAPWVSRRQAAETLGRLRTPAASAVPVLLRIVDEESETHVSSRSWTLKALALFGPVAKDAAPRLAKLVLDPSEPLADRQQALEALAQIGTEHAATLPTILELLRAPDRMKSEGDDRPAVEDALALRELAVETFTLLGPRGAPAIPALLRLSREPSDILRMKTAQALGAMGGRGEIAVPTLAEMLLFDDSPLVRDAAGEALSKIGGEAVPALIQLLNDSEEGVRSRSAEALGRMGTAARPALEALTDRLGDDSALVRIAVAEAIWKASSEALRVVPAIVRGLTEEDRQLRIRAFRLLMSMGRRAAPAIEPLKALATDERGYVRDVARKALERLEPR